MLRKFGIVIVLCAALFACSTTPEPHQTGGPYYFGRLVHPFPSYYPTLPSGEISWNEATSRSFFVVAWFNDRGQIERMVKCLDSRASFDLRYRYGPDGAYEGENFLPLPPAESAEGRRLARACS